MTEPAQLSPTSPEFQQQVSSQAGSLLEQCSKVSVRVSWFSTSTKVKDDQAEQMVQQVDADRRALSISKRLLVSKHPAVKQCNQARDAIGAFVKSWTIPVMAVTGDGVDDGARKVAGDRLIQKNDMQEFDRRLQGYVSALKTAVQNLQAKMPEVIEQDRERLGKTFNAGDYPTDVTKLVKVTVRYEPTGVDIDWQQLCPEVYARMRQSAQQAMENVVKTAAEEFTAGLLEAVELVTKQLGARRRLNPEKGHPRRDELMDAEVVSELSPAEDPSIPEGHVAIEVVYSKNGRKHQEWLTGESGQDLTLAEYRKLQIYDADDRRKIYASSIEQLKTQLDTFLQIGSMLGPYKDLVGKSVTEVREILQRAARDMDSESIAKQARTGDFYRDELRKKLVSVTVAVQSATGISQKRRRSIDPSLVGKMED
jgi:hypothetical protein